MEIKDGKLEGELEWKKRPGNPEDDPAEPLPQDPDPVIDWLMKVREEGYFPVFLSQNTGIASDQLADLVERWLEGDFEPPHSPPGAPRSKAAEWARIQYHIRGRTIDEILPGWIERDIEEQEAKRQANPYRFMTRTTEDRKRLQILLQKPPRI